MSKAVLSENPGKSIGNFQVPYLVSISQLTSHGNIIQEDTQKEYERGTVNMT
jgi:hypothetical protein